MKLKLLLATNVTCFTSIWPFGRCQALVLPFLSIISSHFCPVSNLTSGCVMCSSTTQVPLEEGLNKTIQYFARELEHQANNQYIPKPKAARMKKGRPRHN